MLTLENLMSLDKEEIPEAAKIMNRSEIPSLVKLLAEKNDKIRYHAFLLLQYRSMFFNDVYPFWEDFCSKLSDSNSYQRSIGIMLIAENVRWDTDNKIEPILDECKKLLKDEKPITVRQSIQSFGKIADAKPYLHERISHMLMAIDLLEIQETMRKSILLDIIHVLISIRKINKNEQIDCFLFHSLTGGILDKKSIKQIEMLLA